METKIFKSNQRISVRAKEMLFSSTFGFFLLRVSIQKASRFIFEFDLNFPKIEKKNQNEPHGDKLPLGILSIHSTPLDTTLNKNQKRNKSNMKIVSTIMLKFHS